MGNGPSIRRKILLALLGVALVCAIFVGVGIVARKTHATTVKVIPVMDLDQAGMYGEGESALYGEVTSSVTQKVQLIQDAVIAQVYVKAGDRVRPGDKLLTYDMTLKQLELELERLQKQNLENKLAQAKARLESLENGGPITDPGEDYTPIDDGDDGDDGQEEAAHSSYLRAFAQLPLRLAAASLSGQETIAPDPSQEPEQDKDHDKDQEQGAGAGQDPDKDPDDDQKQESPILYELLDYDSVPYRGTGSEDDPFCFLCTGSREGVVVKGSFFNKMAGYNAAGLEQEGSGQAYWYRLEFHENDQIADLADPDRSLLGYYVRQGKDVRDPDDEKIFTLEGARQTDDGESVLTPTPEPEVVGPNKEVDEEEEEEEDWEEDWEDDDWEDDEMEEPSMTREEAIRYQQNNIQAYELDIQKKALTISKLEKELENETITSTMEGIVTVVGDPQTGESEGDAFIEIESDDGYYIKGSLGELMLERVKVGDQITGNTYESGASFTAEIREIAPYPSGGSQDYFTMGMGNPNVSNYPFVAHVTEDLDLENGETADLKIGTSQQAGEGAVCLDPAMVRSEGGQYYVYKEQDGRLKKQPVTAEKSSDGYTVIVKKGLDSQDKIAFPYGSGVEDGAKTEDGTVDELYGY